MAGVVSAPLYDSTTHRFAGMFTLADVVHLIQYYYLTAHKYENVIAEVEAFQLESLRGASGCRRVSQNRLCAAADMQ